MAFFTELFANRILVSAVLAWSLAQFIKIPLNFLIRREWDWRLVFSAGGMPSSHSALVTGVSFGIGLEHGFNSPLFAIAGVVAMIVIYELKEVLGHTPREVLGGIALGILVSVILLRGF
jgi:uncharacterized protein